MPIPLKYTAPFEQGAYYHVICKALGNQRLFLNDENRRYFLQQYDHYLKPYLYTCCYILLDNHCHFLIQVKDETEIISHVTGIDDKKRTIQQRRFISGEPLVTINTLLERQFNSFFVSYTRSFNNLYKRKGHLFDSPFKRIFINNESHLVQVVVYIHANAIKHNLTDRMEGYSWSSFNDYLLPPQRIETERIVNIFGGKEQFLKTHKIQTEYYYKFDE